MMAGVRQMPELYLRGSLANITMANLSPQEKQIASEYFEIVKNHPEMQKHKSKLIQQLSITISADYKDPQIAEAEFDIAIWKGIIDLFFHHKYTFQCQACQSTTYITRRNKVKTIDRITKPCPNCNAVIISKSDIDGKIPGDTLDYKEYLELIENNSNAIEIKSTIKPIPEQDRKHKDPGVIFRDPDQMRKLMGEYVWNYFRQHISENKRAKSDKETIIVEKADIISALKIINTCQRHDIKIQTDETFSKISIKFKTYITPPEFTVELSDVLYLARQNDINIVITQDGIDVIKNEFAKELKEKMVVTDHIKLQGNSEEEQEHFGKVSKGGNFVDIDSSTTHVDLEEALQNIRDSLPDGVCKSIFNIKTQYGDDYQRFATQYANAENPHNSQIATHLNIGTRQIHAHMDTIKMTCIAKGLRP